MIPPGGAFRAASAVPFVDVDEALMPDMALAQFILTLRASGVRDKDLLVAFEKTTRGIFMPRSNQSLLYAPYALPIDCGAEATPPQVVAMVLGALNLKPGMRVLDIGTGSGYQAAVLARFGCQVVTLERFHTLHLAAARAMPAPMLRAVSPLSAMTRPVSPSEATCALCPDSSSALRR